MKRNLWRMAFCAAAIAATGVVLAADRIDIGKREYDANCAICHGLVGKGDGPYKMYLNKAAHRSHGAREAERRGVSDGPGL